MMQMFRSFLNQLLPGVIFLAGACNPSSGTQLADEPAPYGPIPTPAQLNWHEMEMYCLIHFTPTTFQNKEWGFGDAPVELFNPQKFDANQIAEAARSAGFNGLISVAKHHDGFCLWPTKTTAYSIAHSPWRNGKGDMVREFEQAARKQGMQFGIYVSAWDRNHPEYGNEKYADAYREQLRELYNGYGELFTSWHDGANGGDGYYGGANEMRRIDRSIYYEWEEKTWPITRDMQPSAVIFSDIGPDVRWVGNEKGIAGETCWATFTPLAPDGGKPAPGHIDERFLGTGQRDGRYWIPAECDVPHRPGWFYHPEQDHQVKTPDQLFDLYLKSVGRGAAFNLGLAPTTDGILHTNDVTSLKAFGEKLSKTFGENLALGSTFEASNIRDRQEREFGPLHLLDNDRYSYWATDDEETSPELVISLKNETTFDLIRLRENIKLGQRLDSVWVDVRQADDWVPLAMATSIGSSRIIRLDEPVTAKQLRLRLFAPVAIALSDFGLFREAQVAYRIQDVYRTPLSRALWTAVGSQFEGGDSRLAIDGKWETFWYTSATQLPAHFEVDMGQAETISGFSYVPRQDGNAEGLISHYTFETSADGTIWEIAAAGEFSNIVANPIAQHVALGRQLQARYFRFTVSAVANAPYQPVPISIAEIEVY
ncbi:alpha-L-fucosidase [Parapedobacter deserti]|uniref:alpha-L-fucosidase n=1 Tax=Parapedobacter deserti TaxID=1912957 RepID=A0ABV7JQX7_9SPHI